jgi:hypothetical protein
MHPQAAPRRLENLAFVFQELLTVGERLRSNRELVTDATDRGWSVGQTMWQDDPTISRRGRGAPPRCAAAPGPGYP